MPAVGKAAAADRQPLTVPHPLPRVPKVAPSPLGERLAGEEQRYGQGTLGSMRMDRPDTRESVAASCDVQRRARREPADRLR